MRQVEYLLEVAMRDEKKGYVKEAIDMYTCAVELALKVVCTCMYCECFNYCRCL